MRFFHQMPLSTHNNIGRIADIGKQENTCLYPGNLFIPNYKQKQEQTHYKKKNSIV